jgi:putative colanic acid biosynthesis acetyltransferase WcaF
LGWTLATTANFHLDQSIFSYTAIIVNLSDISNGLQSPEVVDPNKVAANPHSVSNKIVRTLWKLCYLTLYRPSPRNAHKFRVLLLRLFGATVAWSAHPYPKCKIWLPRHLTMGAHSCLADDVDCYNVAPIILEPLATVSQYSYLCSATHDINDPDFPLFSRPIVIRSQAWVAARSYIGPGICVSEGAVVGANACVYKDVPPWTVVGGNPARAISRRKRHCQAIGSSG